MARRGSSFGLALATVLALGACKRGPASEPSPATDAASHAARSPDVVRRDGNHLANAASAYLRAHGHDPIEWYPWGPEALDRAKAENKPIFLSIGYVACHWCHVMQHEVFSKDDVATLLNERFIAIKVDREERPDLDRIYLAAVEAMTGSGGWPATLFLTPGLEPFFGATYVEHDRFLSVAERGAKAYVSGESEIASTTAELRRALAPHDPAAAKGVNLEEAHAVAVASVEHVDLARGGFAGRMKFPLPVRWTFLLHAWRRWGDERVARALRVTLDAMASGALRDPISGGFHRYTTDATWSTPHFEEMLYDNAQLAQLYLEAGLASNEPRWLEIARETLDFITHDMTTTAGAFAASFDADTKGVEGVAWTWSKDELVAVLGAKDGATVAAVLDVSEGPARAPARRAPFASPEAEQTWKSARPKLREARASKAIRDDKTVTSWNGLAIAALARGAIALGNAAWLDAATRAAEHVWKAHHEEPKRLLRTATLPQASAVLDDYACLALGFLALFEATSSALWLDRAIVLVDEATARFAAKSGAFYAADAPPPFSRSVPIDDGAEPSGNAVMLRVLVELAQIGARSTEWRASVTKALGAYAGPMRERGLEMAGWLDALLLDAGPFYELVIAGAPSDAAPLDKVARELAAPWVSTIHVPADGADPGVTDRLPGLVEKNAAHGAARAFVCERGACKLPSSDPAALRRQLLAGWMH